MNNQYGWENIKLPKNLDEKIAEAVNNGKSQKRKVVYKRIGYSFAGMAAAFALCFVMGMKFPVVANAMGKVPIIGNVFSYLYGLEGYEGKYTQVAEEAKLAERPETVVGTENNAEQPENQAQADDDKTVENLAGGETQTVVTAGDQGLTITVTEYYCDKNNLYLSVEVIGEETVFADVAPYAEGAVQFYMADSIRFDDTKPIAGSEDGLLAEGVFLNENTFIGIARVDIATVAEEHSIELPDTFVYTMSGKHIKAYCMEQGVIYDVRGLWELDMEVICDSDTLQVLPVNAFAENGCGIVEVRQTDYEVQVSVVAGAEAIWVVAFDQNGNLLEYAGDELNIIHENYEVWKFAGKEDLQTLHIYVVEESKWLDEWKGQRYDGVLTGSEMMALLAENSFVADSVEVQ